MMTKMFEESSGESSLKRASKVPQLKDINHIIRYPTELGSRGAFDHINRGEETHL